MRAFVELMDSFNGTVRLLIGAFVLLGFIVVLTMTAGVSFVAPKVAADYGERAERLGERAIAAAQEEARARELADDGWGYSAPSADETSSRGSDGEKAGGWGNGGG